MTPVSFRDAEQVSGLGNAGYLRLLPADGEGRYLSALLTVNARGEPVEFTWNELRMNHPALWKGIDRKRYAAKRLISSLLKRCAAAPLFLLYLLNEIPPELFREDLLLSIPVCGIGNGRGTEPNPDCVQSGQPIQQLQRDEWIPETPAEGSRTQVLLAGIIGRGAFLEPFHRASAGLLEVFPESFRYDPEEQYDTAE